MLKLLLTCLFFHRARRSTPLVCLSDQFWSITTTRCDFSISVWSWGITSHHFPWRIKVSKEIKDIKQCPIQRFIDPADTSPCFYRVTHHIGSNLPLTSRQKFRIGLSCPDPARPKQNFCFEVNGRFESRDVSPCTSSLFQIEILVILIIFLVYWIASLRPLS